MWSKLAAAVAMFAAVTGISSALEPWGYSEHRPGQLGPSHWMYQYPSCNGTRQSPVNLPLSGPHFTFVPRPQNVVPLQFEGFCDDFTLKTLEDVYRWEVRESRPCYVVLPNGRKFALAQFHVHTPSEHVINGQRYHGEIHFVHKDTSSGALMVTGLLLSVQPTPQPNSWIENVWSTMMRGKENVPLPFKLKLSYTQLLNYMVQNSRVLNYKGSLTTPPCSEIVDWWVLQTPLAITMQEFAVLDMKVHHLPSTSEFGDNNRPIQKLHTRRVVSL